jgi:probable rRNA maturation factor
MSVDLTVEGTACAGAWGDLSGAVQETAESALEVLGKTDHELSIVLTDDPHIQSLNRDFREKDAPTDVLSFGQLEGEPFVTPIPHLGDLVISLETAARQAQERGHPVEAEVRILLVHGLMHLLGHDHMEPGERALMAQAEDALLVSLPVHPQWPTSSGLVSLQDGK